MFRFLTFRAKYEGDDDDGNDYTLRRQKIIENLSKSRRFLASYNYQQQHQQHSWFLGRLPHLHHTITIYLSLSNLTSYNDIYFASLVVAWEKIFWELLSLSRHLHLRKNFNNFQRRWLRLCHYHPISIVLPLPISLSLSLSLSLFHTHTQTLSPETFSSQSHKLLFPFASINHNKNAAPSWIVQFSNEWMNVG